MIPIHRVLCNSCHLVLILASGSPAADMDLSGDALPPGAVARLGTTRLRQAGVLHAVAFTPDGKTLASLAGEGSYRKWDPVTGRMIPEKPGEKLLPVRDLLHTAMGLRAVSPDGRMVATGDRDGVIHFTDADTLKELSTLKYPGEFEFGEIKYLAYASDGKTLISLSAFTTSPNRSECHQRDLATGKVLRHWKVACAPAAVSPDGKTLAFGVKDSQMGLWDLATGNELRRFDLPSREGVTASEAARCAAFSPDCKLLAVGDLTNRVHVWDVVTGKELHCSQPSRNWIISLAFSPDGKTLAVANWHRILLLEAISGKDLLPLVGGHDNQVNRVAFTPDGKTVATQTENAIVLWDPLTGREWKRLSDDRHLVGFTPDGNLLLGVKGSIVQREVLTNKTTRTFKAYERELPDDIGGLSAVFSRDGKTMATGSYERTIRLWNLETGKEVWRAKRTDKGIRFPADIGGHWPLGFTRDGKAVVSIAHDAVLRFWDAATGKELRSFRIDSREAALSPDGR